MLKLSCFGSTQINVWASAIDFVDPTKGRNTVQIFTISKLWVLWDLTHPRSSFAFSWNDPIILHEHHTSYDSSLFLLLFADGISRWMVEDRGSFSFFFFRSFDDKYRYVSTQRFLIVTFSKLPLETIIINCLVKISRNEILRKEIMRSSSLYFISIYFRKFYIYKLPIQSYNRM